MKRRFLSVKELAEELGVHEDTIYRAHLKNMIPVKKVRKVLRFDLDIVLEAFAKKAEEKSSKFPMTRATGGNRRRRARAQSPRSVKRGRNFQTARMSKRRRT
jgi:excisionase family DNA binding protein